jgi:hypothetical protein
VPEAVQQQRDERREQQTTSDYHATIWDRERWTYNAHVEGACRESPQPPRQPPSWVRWEGSRIGVPAQYRNPWVKGCRLVQNEPAKYSRSAKLIGLSSKTLGYLHQILAYHNGQEFLLNARTASLLEAFLDQLFNSGNRDEIRILLSHYAPVVRFFVARRALREEDQELNEWAMPALRDGSIFRFRRDCVHAAPTLGTALVDTMLRSGDVSSFVGAALSRERFWEDVGTCSSWGDCRQASGVCKVEASEVSFVTL